MTPSNAAAAIRLPASADEAEAWAREWIAAWNAHDLAAVLARFADEVEFRSPKAALITGRGTVRGKPALEAYWRAALAQIGALHFVFDCANWDPVTRTLVIRYIAELGAELGPGPGKQRLLAAEILDLDGQGRARRGTALYGAPAD